ncbi:NfeD family protein [Baekduia sp. Peel2402]|uniref:NfeD family protein n=1 Tax=Baekduia sp. Peel2402 TaxID=3458296 RepID=UPI00403EADC1
MDAWLIWLICAVAAAVGEILTAGFFLAPFSAGAFGGMLAALLGAGAVIQLIAFFAVTIACFALVRPIARRHMYTPPSIRTGTAALIGRSGIVLERVANDEGVGSVRIDGEVWTARSLDDHVVIDAGTKVEVVEIRGATALVAP